MAQSPRVYPPLLVLLLALAAQCLFSLNQEPWTLAPGLALFALSLWFFRPMVQSPGVPPKKEELPPRTELALAALVGATALFFRLYRLTQIPPGLTVEETCGPWLGFSSPPSEWVRFDPSHIAMAYLDVSAFSSLWFHLFEPSRLSYSLMFVSFSLLSFPLAYWFFRDLAGPQAALLTLFLLSAMQWHVTLSRNGHPIITTAFYVMATLSFGSAGLRQGRPAYWALAGVFCGLGFYSHPSFRACLLLLPVLLAYEVLSKEGPPRRPWPGVGLFLFCFFTVSGYCWWSMWRDHWLIGGTYDDQMFVGQAVLRQKSLMPLWINFTKATLLLNRAGSATTQEGVPGHPLLDPVTGALFVLGFFLCCRRWRERKYFYSLAGLGILSLPGLLSLDPAHSSRILAAAPFLAFMAANAALSFGKAVTQARNARPWVMALGLGLAAVLLSWNFKTYFMDRPANEACWLEADMAPTRTGQAIADNGDAYEYYLSPAFFGHFAVLFLGHSQRAHTHALEVPLDFKPLSPPGGRGLFFVLQEGRTGVLGILQKLYPGGGTEEITDPWGRPTLYFFKVPAAAVGNFTAPKWGRTWQGTYWNSLSPSAKPLLMERDPVLNFSYRDDFPVKGALVMRAEWKGTLKPAKAGTYSFLLLATEHTDAFLEMDGKPLAATNRDAAVYLKSRPHAAVVRLRREGGVTNAFHLLWKPPGADHYEVLPPEALE